MAASPEQAGYAVPTAEDLPAEMCDKAFQLRPDGLPAIHARFQRVLILRSDALDVTRQQDGRRTFFYCDSPHLKGTRTMKDAYGRYEITAAQHRALLEALVSIEGRFLLSGCHSLLYDRTAARHDWRSTEFTIDNKAGSGATKRAMIECVWTSYTLPSYASWATFFNYPRRLIDGPGKDRLEVQGGT